MKKFLIFLFFGSFVFFSTKTSLASNDFETSFNVTQTVGENGATFVNQEISLVNKLSRVYATQYGLTLESSNIKNIKAYDARGPLEAKIEKEGETTTITVVFSEKTVGIECPVAVELKNTANELVGARLVNHLDLGTSSIAGLRSGTLGGNRVLGQEFNLACAVSPFPVQIVKVVNDNENRQAKNPAADDPVAMVHKEYANC